MTITMTITMTIIMTITILSNLSIAITMTTVITMAMSKAKTLCRYHQYLLRIIGGPYLLINFVHSICLYYFNIDISYSIY